jgi:Flp pilus assembly protein TadG
MLRRAPAQAGRPRRGAAIVELAVLLPLLVFLFLIAIDFGRIFYCSLTVENCARNGALYASGVANSQMPYADIQSATLADGGNLSPPLQKENVAVTNGTDADGNPVVKVTVTYTFQSLTSFPGIPASMTFTRAAQMRVAPAAPTR